jgi:hypothetical protein
MKEFLVGLLFIIVALLVVAVGSMLGILLFPLLIVLNILLRFVIAAIIVIFAIWLVGKMVMMVWEKVKR